MLTQFLDRHSGGEKNTLPDYNKFDELIDKIDVGERVKAKFFLNLLACVKGLAEQPPGNPPSIIDRNNQDLSPRAERTMNEAVPRGPESAPRPHSLYASIVDPNEGTALDFVPISEINGIKCAKIALDDIEEEIAYWQNAVVCCVLGANPPVEVIEGFVRRIWSDYAIDKVMQIKKGLYLMRFLETRNAEMVAHKGLYHFDHKPFIGKSWTPELDINTDRIATLPIWIQPLELDIKYWGGPKPQ
ncbi:hypothetical protein Cgig2_015761 [Carnegiea gigantea]|uniref:DUF4283 domain-containing protein n=1 Tax=Carnegiea gigantea TaxID=171969 RepID=A0A9Q1JKZ3_9CARY|nr:hypothetical protein Cgig2_015761 [Carnegiea gigantea]